MSCMGCQVLTPFWWGPKFRGVTRSHRKVWCVFPSEGGGWVKNLRDWAKNIHPLQSKWPPSHDLCPGCSMDMGTKDHHQCWQWDFHDAGPWSNPWRKKTMDDFRVSIFLINSSSIQEMDKIIWTYWHVHVKKLHWGKIRNVRFPIEVQNGGRFQIFFWLTKSNHWGCWKQQTASLTNAWSA